VSFLKYLSKIGGRACDESKKGHSIMAREPRYSRERLLVHRLTSPVGTTNQQQEASHDHEEDHHDEEEQVVEKEKERNHKNTQHNIMPKSREPHRSRSEKPYSRDEHRQKKDDDGDTAPCSTFDALQLKPELLKGIYAYGFEKPSAIQQRAIRPMLRGRDVIAQSQSGTGKVRRAAIVIVATRRKMLPESM
jgi:hypothetical protein